MLRVIRPGPLPKWLDVSVRFAQEDARQSVLVSCWCIAWRRNGVTRLRPLFGGDVLTVRSGGGETHIDHPRVRIYSTPILPVRRGSKLLLKVKGQRVHRAR